MLEVHQIPVLVDNYIYLVHEPVSGVTAVVDPAVSDIVLRELEQKHWQLDYIFNTHHHADHVGGNLSLKKASGCKIIGAKSDHARIPGIDVGLSEGEKFKLGNESANIFEVDGHTLGHIAFWFESAQILFCGDTLFAMGCGRLFEGSPAQMWEALQKLRQLPSNTTVYCTHEYTEANGRFALSVEPGNTKLQTRMRRVQALRQQNKPTIPFQIREELTTNPFLRADQANLKLALGMETHTGLEVFTELRHRKNNF